MTQQDSPSETELERILSLSPKQQRQELERLVERELYGLNILVDSEIERVMFVLKQYHKLIEGNEGA